MATSPSNTVFNIPLKVREVLRMLPKSDLLLGNEGDRFAIAFYDREVLQIGGNNNILKTITSNFCLTLRGDVPYAESIESILSFEGQKMKFFNTRLTYGDVVQMYVSGVDVIYSRVAEIDGLIVGTHSIILYIPGLAKKIYDANLKEILP